MNINCNISVKESDRVSTVKIKFSIEVKIESFDESNGMTTPLFRGSKPVRAKSSGSISEDEIPVAAAMEESGLRTFLSEERVANLGASLASIYRNMERARREGEMDAATLRHSRSVSSRQVQRRGSCHAFFR